MATALGPNHQKPNASRKEKVKVATPKTTKGSDPALLEKNNTDGKSVVEKDISPPVPKIKNEAKNPTCLHPNQPTSSEVSPVPKSAELRSAAIKWKSKLSVHDNGESKERKSPAEVALLEKNDSSVVSIGRESPRNHLTLNAEASDNEVGASPTRKLSLGDFVTQEVATTKEPEKWENMNSSTTGLSQSLPYVPVSLAYVCLLMNVVIPGLGKHVFETNLISEGGGGGLKEGVERRGRRRNGCKFIRIGVTVHSCNQTCVQ